VSAIRQGEAEDRLRRGRARDPLPARVAATTAVRHHLPDVQRIYPRQKGREPG